jgi:flagellar motor protein MotB
LKGVEGLFVEARDDSIVVGFREPLFDRGSEELSLRSRGLLSKLVTALGEEESGIEVTIRGYTDGSAILPGGRWPDNWTLGLARAAAAARHLKREWGDRRVVLTATSAAGTLPPGTSSLGEPASRSVDVQFTIPRAAR